MSDNEKSAPITEDNIKSKLWETASAMVICTVVFGFVTHVVHAVMAHQEKIARINNEK